LNNKKVFLFLVRLLVGAGIIFFLFKLVPYQNLIEIYKASSKGYIILGLGVYFSCFIFGVLRWRLLLRALGVSVSVREVSISYLSSLFFNLFLPSLVGGDMFRGLSLSYRKKEYGKVFSSVLMDRFSGAFAMGCIGFCAYLIGHRLIQAREVFFALCIFMAVLACATLVIFSKRFFSCLVHILRDGRFKRKIVNFHDQLYFFKNNPRVFLKSLGYSLIIQLIVPLSFFIFSKAFFLETSLISFYILVPIVMVIALLPISIAGLGTREAAAVYFFSTVGIAESVALGISLLNFVAMVIPSIVGGIVYVVVYHRWLESGE